MNFEEERYLPLEECKKGGVYRLDSRNLSYGVYDGEDGFIGLRYKFGDTFLFTEYHWDTENHKPYGTVKPLKLMEMLPVGVKAEEDLGRYCGDCGKDAYRTNGYKFFHGDGTEMCPTARFLSKGDNTLLFDYLEEFLKDKEF